MSLDLSDEAAAINYRVPSAASNFSSKKELAVRALYFVFLFEPPALEKKKGDETQ